MRARANEWLFLLMGTAVLGSGCSANKPETASAASLTPTPPPASSTAASPEPSALIKTEDFLIVSGPLIVEHQVDITAQRDGVLGKILFDTPVRVKAGTVLARLDDRQAAANLEAARAKSRSTAADLKNWESEAEVLKADYARQQRLWDLGLTSEEQLQHAKYKAESDQWDIQRVQEMLNTAHEEERSLELELEKMKITAPFDGMIARRYVREGQSVSKGDRLFWITAEAPLLVRFTLPEKYFGHVRSAQQFEITSPDVTGEKHAARVKEVSPVVDPSSGTIEVLVELTGPRGGLRPGMTASVRVPNPQ
jgi:membrane fusion protein, multidrug efflux system